VPETNAREADIYDDWTLEEFVEVTKRLTKRDSSGKVTRWGYARYAGFHQIVSMMRRSGGDALAPDRKTVIVDSDESIDGVRYEDDLFHQHQVRPTPDAETDNPRNLFINGLAASFCHGAASATQLKRLLADKFDYVGVLIPRHSEKDTRGLILSTGGNCISSQSKSPDAAWEYCKFMGSQQIGVLRTVMGGAGPGGRPDVWYDERIQSYHRVIPKFAELIPQAKPHVIPWNNRASEYQDAVTQNIDKIWLGNVTVEEGCKLAAEAARKVMAQDPI
jgi:multiple sugar transport system substrate-binding protein